MSIIYEALKKIEREKREDPSGIPSLVFTVQEHDAPSRRPQRSRSRLLLYAAFAGAGALFAAVILLPQRLGLLPTPAAPRVEEEYVGGPDTAIEEVALAPKPIRPSTGDTRPEPPPAPPADSAGEPAQEAPVVAREEIAPAVEPAAEAAPAAEQPQVPAAAQQDPAVEAPAPGTEMGEAPVAEAAEAVAPAAPMEPAPILESPPAEIAARPVAAAPASGVTSKIPDLTLKGVSRTGSRSWAFINDKMVKPGDSIEGAEVVEILSDRVRLLYQGMEFTLAY